MDKSNDYDYLGEALDALDRLYDGESGAKEVQVILKLVGLGVSERELGGQISDAANHLLDKIQAAQPAALDSQDALRMTDAVRGPMADAWADLDFERNPDHRSP